MIEVITFRLGGGTGEASFLAADDAFRTEFLYAQRGLARATTARGADGEWIVILIWATEADADAATVAAETDPAATRFFGLVEAASLGRRRYATLD